MSTIDSQRGFTILSAILSTDRNDASIDLAAAITDIDIYEHLDKPYLTGNFVFVDTHAIVQQINMMGIEKLELKLETVTKNVIEKTFRIVKINKAIKTNDRSELIVLDVVEEHAFISNAINVNKAYTGTPATIISNIASSFLEKDVQGTFDTFQGNMKVIVPNMTPIAAIKWMQQRATNKDGMPYYVYSLLTSNFLQLNHLGTLLQREPNNKDRPFVYSQAGIHNPVDVTKYHVIESYKQENTENLFQLISDGYVGARYNFLNVSDGYPEPVDFDVKKDVFDMMKNKNYLGKNQDNYNFPTNTKIKSNTLNEQRSKVISRITSSNLYEGFGDFKSYGEEIKKSDYNKQICGEAIKKHLAKSPLSISVNGAPFLITGSNLTTGTVLRLKFFDSNTFDDAENKELGIDKKKSGDYIVYATRHSFKIEKYDLDLLCTKIADYTGENL